MPLTNSPSPADARANDWAGLLDELLGTLALIDSATKDSERSRLQQIYVQTRAAYDLTLTRIPAATKTMGREQERLLWNRMALIREWLEKTASRLDSSAASR